MTEPEPSLSRIVDSLPDGVVAVDAEGAVTWANRAAGSLLPGLTPGRELADALAGRTSREEVAALLRDGGRIELERTGASPPLAIVAAPRADEPTCAVLSIRDLSELEEMNRLRNSFVVSASHELRTPLTSLVGFAELLDMEGDDLTPERAEAARIIHQNARYVSSLVMDLLDLSRGNFGQLTVSPAPTSLPKLIDEVALSMRQRTEGRRQRIEVACEAGLPEVEADRGRIKQVLFNLIDNAHLYSPDGTVIRVGAERCGGGVEMTVGDEGPGISFEDPEEVFGSFARGQAPEVLTVPGAGIGLTISKRLVELHGGRIRAESRPGAGATFAVWLPVRGGPSGEAGA